MANDIEKLERALELIKEVQQNRRADGRMAGLIEARRGIRQSILYLEETDERP